LRVKSHRFREATLQPNSANPLAKVKAELVELQAEFDPGTAAEVAFTVRGATIVYDAMRQELVVNGHRAPAPLRGGKQRLTIFCDRTGLETFASDGLTYVPMPFQPKADNLTLGVRVAGGEAKVGVLRVHELGSIWK
jgi:sucrose-6-phosphate hydrolase SacC (GH32 family)